ncbi:hypothetical protein BH23CHL1_BH23CHL1_20160 [soil metagenome]
MERGHTQIDSQTKPTSIWERRALVSGILFVVVAIAGTVFAMLFMFPNMAAIDAPIAERAAASAEHGTTILVANYLLMLQVPFLLVFLAGLYVILRRAEGDSGMLSLTALASGITMVSMLFTGWMIAGIMNVFIANEGGDAATVSAFDALAPMSLALSAFPRAVLLGAVSLLVLQHGLSARWIGIAGFVLAAIHLLGTSTLVEGGFFPIVALGSLLFTVWTLALSVSLLRRPVTATQPATRAALA